ncbi:UNVERIFIED_CONTAM: hypothetical protein GTU68_025451 [Idotea baltica]|nr:hypothetical protein [Idotea baltica]
MAQITAALVKQLREKTGAGMMDAKKALVESNGDEEAATEWLRAKGLSKAAKKSGRTAADGLVAVSVSEDGKSGTVVELNSETDFVARNETFQQALAGIAKAAMSTDGTVEAVNAAAAPVDLLEKKNCFLMSSSEVLEKPENIIENMIKGRIAKFYKEVVLVEQQFVMNPDQTVAEFLKENNAELKGFVSFTLGEGIEKAEDNFADEVASMTKGS